MDCDLSMPPEVIPKLIKALGASDIAVGSRYVKGGKDKRNFTRRITSIMVNQLANLILDFKVLDYDSGFIAAKREVFDKVRFEPKGHGEYCIEFLYKAGKKGFKIKEVPFIFVNRIKGESKTSRYIYSIAIYGMKYVLKILKLRFHI